MSAALSLAVGGGAVAALAAVLLLRERRHRRGLFQLVSRGKEEWEATFDAISEGIALVTAAGVIRRSNTAFAALAGRPVTAVVGAPLGEALRIEAGPLGTLLAAAAAGGRPAPVVHHSEEQHRTLRLAASPVARAVDGATFVVVVEDITEQQALEAQLIQSEKMAAVGTLVSGIAHELNNPLTSIAGLSEFLLEQSAAASTGREHLRVINEQAERAGHIVRDLLTFARKGPATRTRVDLGDVARRSLELMGYEMKRRGITSDISIAPGLPEVLGDRHQLQQVALNLIGNAVHAVRGLADGAPRRVSLDLRAEAGRVVLRVTDSGPGISDDVRAQMFSPFFTTKAPGEGTGLGLFVSYGIAEAHGGTLTVESRSGPGATLALALPQAPEETAAGPGSAAAAATASRRILVVDDDPVVRQVVSALFAREGHRVDAAVNGIEAMRLASRERYDLVIADRLVAAGDQPIAAALAHLPGDLGARLILSTSDARRDSDDRLAPGARVLVKPFDLRELKKAAEEVFRTADQSPDAKLPAVPGL